MADCGAISAERKAIMADCEANARQSAATATQSAATAGQSWDCGVIMVEREAVGRGAGSLCAEFLL